MTGIKYAHIRADGKGQPIIQHLEAVARIAEAFTSVFNMNEYGYCAGYLHDIGKYAQGFQNRLYGSNMRFEHSSAGAFEVLTTSRNIISYIIAYSVAGHHAGLPDGGSDSDSPDSRTLKGKVKRQGQHGIDYAEYHSAIDIKELLPRSLPRITQIDKGGFNLAFMTRMVFSALVDADFLDTEAFMNGSELRCGMGESMGALKDKLDLKLEEFNNPQKEIYKKRNEILGSCIGKASLPRGFFSLTVPTGGGKTLSSAAFALNHAVKNGIRRVIYVIPYTSIIDQTVSIFEEIFGKGSVLAHHSTVRYDDEGEEMEQKCLTAENWDAPIIVTTNVQFFESLFSSKTSKCRKLHNIANSVIILDEAQMLPIGYLLPCTRAIRELVDNYRCSVVFCTATQPALDCLYRGSVVIHEICENRRELYDFFRRTRFEQLGTIDDKLLSDRLTSHARVLCIVNNRRHASALYSMLPKEGRYHLTTYMHPLHRKRVINEIKARVLDNSNPICRVVATSLIEVGVDVDFPTVYREAAGLDTMIQAAGRCNREGLGRADDSMTYIFKSEEYVVPPEVKKYAAVADSVADNYPDIAAPEAINEYFNLLYKVKGEALDSKKIIDSFESGARSFMMPFAEADREFKLIENDSYSIFIPEDEEGKMLGEKIKNMFKTGKVNRETIREAALYTVNVYKNEYMTFIMAGTIEILDEIAILSDMSLYSDETGLNPSKTGKADFI